jgi:small redox-active disulfide protein 2
MIMRIEVLGSGCAKCKRLHRNVDKAVKKTGVKAEIVKVEDINEIIERGVMITPGLIVDGTIISTGKVLGVEEIMVHLK